MLSHHLRKTYGRSLKYIGPATFYNQSPFARRPFSRLGRRTSYRPYNNITHPRSEPSQCERLARSNQLYQFTHPEPLVAKQADRYRPKDLQRVNLDRPIYASRLRHEQPLRRHFTHRGYKPHQSGFQKTAEEDLQDYLSPMKADERECPNCEALRSIFMSSSKSRNRAVKNTQPKSNEKQLYIQHDEADFPSLPNQNGNASTAKETNAHSAEREESVWGCTRKVRLALGLMAKPSENKLSYSRRLSGRGVLHRLCPY